MKISLVIPCFNEAAVLPELFGRVTTAASSWGCEWEVICVDDGSSDETWRLVQVKNHEDPRWRGLAFARNFGHQTAVSAGLHHADGDAVIVLDADLQDPPEELGRFIEKWKSGFDVVYAIRENRKEGVVLRFCYWAFYRLMARIVAIDIPLDSGDFCIMDRKVVEVLKAMPERNRFVRGLRAWAGFKQIGLAYERQARAAGNSKYTLRKLLKLAFDGMFSFSAVPLALVSHVGIWVSGLSLAGILFTLAQRLFKDFFATLGIAPVPGFATIVISILFLGGVQLISLGIIGEYIGRIYEEVKRRPQWVIRDAAGLDPQTPAR